MSLQFDVLHDSILFVIKLVCNSDEISCTNAAIAQWKKMKKKCRARNYFMKNHSSPISHD